MGIIPTSEKSEVCSAFIIKDADLIVAPDGNYELYIKFKKEKLIEQISKKSMKKNSKKLKKGFLTKRELEVLKGLTNGKTNSQIAKDLIVTKHTIKAHVSNIIKKLNVENRQQAAMKAVTEKIEFT